MAMQEMCSYSTWFTK